MKRLLTALAILLIVLVAGMTALVLLVDPNDFRAHMIKRVGQKSGYKLTLDSDFRWHVWPQLSIISGRMSLTAPGAQVPLINAENMRLDVKLWPLFSHQLVVKQVMLKGAVIRLTTDSEEHPRADAPIPPAQSFGTASSHWNLDISKIQVIDSLLVWQRSGNPITVRDINLSFEQNQRNQAKLAVSSRVNRDQRELEFSIAADLDLQRYPRQFMATINKFTYKLEGIDLPVAGISGEGSLQASYQDSPRKVVLSKVMLSANNNQFTGSLIAELGKVPHYTINLSADKVNFDTISNWQVESVDSNRPKEHLVSSPIITSLNNGDSGSVLHVLRGFTAQLGITVNNINYHNVSVNELNVKAINQQGKVRLSQLTGKSLGGDFSVTSSLDITGNQALVVFEPVMNHIDLAPMLQLFDLPQIVSGKFFIKGQLSGRGFSVDAFDQAWQGDASVEVTEGRLNGFNIQQLIQQAIARVTDKVSGRNDYERYTEVKRFQARLLLNKGNVAISHLNAHSEFIKLAGQGTVNLPGKQCDIDLIVRVIQGWRGETQLVNKLQLMDIPLRVYGPWNSLKYQLNVDHLLNNELQNKAKKALTDWMQRHQQSQKDNEVKTSLDKL